MSQNAEVLDAQGAADFLGVHVETFRRMARTGAIPAFKIGKDWRILSDSILQWIEKRQPGTRSIDLLIVDDEEAVCRLLKSMIEQMGCKARYATSGAEGLDMVSREPPDLILLDLVMPGMNGPEFLRELRPNHPDLPVVIVTGYPDSDLMNQAAHYAPIMLLAKPVEPAQLERTLRMVPCERKARGVANRSHTQASARADGGSDERTQRT